MVGRKILYHPFGEGGGEDWTWKGCGCARNRMLWLWLEIEILWLEVAWCCRADTNQIAEHLDPII